jgi:hypothetical protein
MMHHGKYWSNLTGENTGGADMERNPYRAHPDPSWSNYDSSWPPFIPQLKLKKKKSSKLNSDPSIIFY